MKSVVFCLKEFAKLNEEKQPVYLVKCGKYLTKNALTFPAITYDGTVVYNHGLNLLKCLGVKDTSDLDFQAYKLKLSDCETMMNILYNEIDGVAKGDAEIVAKAGVNGTSVNTARVGVPTIPKGLQYSFTEEVGELKLGYERDLLAHGAVIITFIDPLVEVKISGKHQILVTVGKVEVLIDVSTTINTVIQNLKVGKKTQSKVA